MFSPLCDSDIHSLIMQLVIRVKIDDNFIGCRYHVQRHAGIYPYHCPYCDKGLACTNDVRHHLRVKHTGKLGFHCIRCGLEFQSVKLLKKHIEEECGLPDPVAEKGSTEGKDASTSK